MQNPKPAGNGQNSSPQAPARAALPPDGVAVLDSIAAFIRRYLICDDHQLNLLALWIACTYCHHHFMTSPYLHIRSAQPHSGRTLCLNILCDLSDATITFSGLPAAPLMDRLLQGRDVDLLDTRDPLQPFPLLIDDYHHSFGPSERQPLVSLLASGSEVTAFFSRGNEDYNLFGPKAFAGNSPLPSSLAVRCIPIPLRHPKPSEKIVPYWSYDDHDERKKLKEHLRQWLKHAFSALAQAAKGYPSDLPLNLAPGQSKCAQPLIHIADVAGGAWPAKVRAALAAVFNLAESNPELQMLFDLRAIFRDKNNPECLATEDLLSQLRALDSRPWSNWNNKSGRRLAGHLRPFGIMSRRLHIDPENDFMGYLLADFQDAWERYLPAAGRGPERIKVSPERSAVQAKTTISAVGAD